MNDCPCQQCGDDRPDLLTRLERLCQGHSVSLPCPIAEAADEIERLRELVNTWIIGFERLVASHDGKDYEKAMEFYLDCQRIANETCK